MRDAVARIPLAAVVRKGAHLPRRRPGRSRHPDLAAADRDADRVRHHHGNHWGGADRSMATNVGVEQTTAFALTEKSKLVKSLRRFDMVFFTICAFVGLDTLGTVAQNGPEGFLWLVVLAVVFVAPYMLVMSEIGSAFTQEGGPYEWTKLAFGRLNGAIRAVLCWGTNPLWGGGSLAFTATAAWSDHIFHIGAGGVGDYAFKLIFIDRK